MMVHEPEKELELMDSIRLNILEKSSVENTELAKEISREWIRKARM